MADDIKRILEIKSADKRRGFLKKAIILPFVAQMALAESKSNPIRVSMNGDLDDDLIIIKASQEQWDVVDCHQMHNPTKTFFLDGRAFDSTHNPGYIKYNKSHTLSIDFLFFYYVVLRIIVILTKPLLEFQSLD